MEDRSTLLQQLNGVYAKCQEIISLFTHQTQIVNSYRSEEIQFRAYKTQGATGKARLTWRTGLLTIMIMLMLISLVKGMLADVAFSIVMIGGLLWVDYDNARVGKAKHRVLHIIVYVLVALAALFFVQNIVLNVARAGAGDIILNLVILAVAALIAVAIMFAYLRFHNTKAARAQSESVQVRADNQELQRLYAQSVQSIEQAKRDLAWMIDGWYPPAYISLEAVSFFMDAIRNFKADTIKEAVNLYDLHDHQAQMRRANEQILANQEQQLINEQAMIGQMKFANLLSIASIGLQSAQLDATNRAANAAESLNQQWRGY